MLKVFAVGEEDVTIQPEGEPDHDEMAKRLHNLFKFKDFYVRWIFSKSKGWPL